ncbi:hypothetical protein C8T65DRAFT_128896 [Cerioporus squamosus]|nr:hypothetical protein C8T65DRAFT_128896 [Cerioporus squamosus]
MRFSAPLATRRTMFHPPSPRAGRVNAHNQQHSQDEKYPNPACRALCRPQSSRPTAPASARPTDASSHVNGEHHRQEHITWFYSSRAWCPRSRWCNVTSECEVL